MKLKRATSDIKMKVTVAARNILVIVLMLFLTSCSNLSRNKELHISQKGEIQKLKSEISEKTKRVKQLDRSVADLREKIARVDDAHKKLQKELAFSAEENRHLSESADNLRFELQIRESQYSDVLAKVEKERAEMEDLEERYAFVLSGLNDEKTKVRDLEKEIKRRSEEVESILGLITVEDKPSAHYLQNSIDDFKQNLPEGSMLYNIPKTMTKGDIDVVTLELSPRNAIDILKSELSEREGVPIEKIEAEVIKVSDLMVATLDGTSGISVRSLHDSNIKPISDIDPNIWRWEIEAIKEGLQKLYLQVGVVLSISGKDRVRNVLDEPREIVVKVSGARSLTSFFKNNWQFLIQIVVIPLIIFIWEQYKKFKRKRISEEISNKQGDVGSS